MRTSYGCTAARLAAGVLAVSAVTWTAGCGSGSKAGSGNLPPRPPSSNPALDTNPRSSVIVVQLAVDTGVEPAANVGPGSVVDGLVKDGGLFSNWYMTGNYRTLLTRDSVVTFNDESWKVSWVIDNIGKSPTPASLQDAASEVVAQYLFDATLISKQTLGTAVDSTGWVNRGDTLKTWYSAHQNDFLPGSSSVTYSTEVTRIIEEIQGAAS